MGRSKRKSPFRERSTGNVLPAELGSQLGSEFEVDVAALEKALSAEAPVSIRINPLKPFALQAQGIPWCSTGRYLESRPSFTFDPLFHAGAYYVQEASSMLVEQAVLAAGAAERDVLALDLCAAPGGKSTHLLSLLTPGSLLVANEIDPGRRNILSENLWKQGYGNCVITGSDPEHLKALPEHFDLILVDAPCSGEGMFRKDPFARAQWNSSLVQRCAAIQGGIVAHAWQALAPGGTLIYSTCTWETAENEDQLAKLVEMGGRSLGLNVVPAWGVLRSERNGVIGYRCFPHLLRGEGFFIAVIQKPGIPNDRIHAASSPSGPALDWLRNDANTAVVEHRGLLIVRPAKWNDLIHGLGQHLHATSPGIPFAERKGEQWVPHASAALSQWLVRDAFPEYPLDLDTSLNYLGGNALRAPEARGTALVSHRGFALGWVQGAGTRWNNRWPPSWRIKGQRSNARHVPWSGVPT